jgi:hypothetical protein
MEVMERGYSIWGIIVRIGNIGGLGGGENPNYILTLNSV